MRIWAAIIAVAALPACAATTYRPPAFVEAQYRCEGGSPLAVRFDNRADSATATRDGRSVVLRGQRPASGIWYAGEGYVLRGKGDRARFEQPDGTATECRAT